MDAPGAAPYATQGFQLDTALVRQRIRQMAQRAGEAEPGADFLAREIARRMDGALDVIRIAPHRILDLGCGEGQDLQCLGERYPEAERIGIDLAAPLLARARARIAPPIPPLRRLFGKKTPPLRLLAADALRIPLADSAASLIWANLLLPFIADPLPAFREMWRVTETGGLLLFSSLGPDTLRELRESLPARAGTRVHSFTDMHDLGDALIAAGFSDPVIEMDMATLAYERLDSLFADLRVNAARNAAQSRPRGLSGRTGWAQARERYEARRREGRLPVTAEIILGHAWKADPASKQPSPRADGHAVMRFHPTAAQAESL